MYCKYCGANIPVNSSFCPNCGNKIIENTKEQNHKYTWLFILIAIMMFTLISLGGIVYWGNRNNLDYDLMSSSVMMLECYDQNGQLNCSGSGALILYENVLVTNYHVISGDCYEINAITDNGDVYKIVSIISYNEKKDIAILQLDRCTGVQPLKIGNASSMKRGDKVTAIGSPMGLINTVSDGIISGFIQDDAFTAIQITAPISEGSSGGALLNKKGELIGITYAGIVEGQNIGFAIPSYEIENVFNSGKVNMAVLDFYNLHDHTIIYTVSEVFALRESINETEIKIIGYVSSKYGNDTIYLLDDPKDILWIETDVMSSNPQEDVEKNREYVGKTVCINTHFMNDNSVNNIHCGDYIEINGYIRVKEFPYQNDEKIETAFSCSIKADSITKIS